MAKLTYAVIAALDGDVEVEEGRSGCATPDEAMVLWQTASAEEDVRPC
ncbi:hypothetical protein DSM104299_00193 [Baekduia alba]|nr:hypothetical protein [Baekduia alba]WCB91522.1 hypothetical protein DSM104299_00193 [Baekduia alba]